MSRYISEKLEAKLIEHEGIRRFPYVDTTGHLTIGVGRNLKSKGLSIAEIMLLLRNDIDEVYKQLSGYSWFKTQNDVRQDALVELAFNLGLRGLLSFKRMIAVLEPLNPSVAAKELLDSKWATQVGPNRANDIASRIRNGRYLDK